jgi:adenine-specific DNA-methyltransferase
MAKKTLNNKVTTADYRHTREKRTNIPPAKIAAEGKVPRVAKVRYHYSPHLPPALQFDPSGKVDKIAELLSDAGKRPLTESEQRLLADAVRSQQPWLEWAGKREQHERLFFEVDPVALHIHERISTQAMLRVLAREDVQRDLFADPQQPYTQAVQFYKHSVDWANRLILGDSLQVMASLARRENLAGKVQMIYVDPPYGIKFASNFQPEIGEREVKDRDQDLTREPEMVRAYRDTWTLGVHSYLTYLRDRFEIAKELLSDTGSIFVQISDENIHRVRSLMDEVFGDDNFCAIIAFVKTSGVTQKFLPDRFDHLVWYAKDKTKAKFRQVYLAKSIEEGTASNYGWIELSSSLRRGMSRAEKTGEIAIEEGAAIYKPDNITSQGNPLIPFEHFGKTYTMRWKTNPEGLTRLAGANRLHVAKNSLQYVRYLSDFGAVPVTKLWSDTATGNFTDEKIYVVQTGTKTVERCLLMTTDPGDLVFDPTCGSGTTGFVAEHWGRRWITCDTSRVALSLARQRLMTARFPYYQLRVLIPDDVARNPQGSWLTDPTGQVPGKATFRCETLPHITLKSIARDAALDPIFEKHQPILAARLKALNIALKQVSDETRNKLAAKLQEKQKHSGKRSITQADRRRWELPKTEWKEWEVPFDTDPDWPKPLQDTLSAYRSAWRTRMDDVNKCIDTNVEMEELVDKPEILSGILRVSGPFTVEGVRPEELSLGEDSPSSPTHSELDIDGQAPGTDRQNLQAYLAQMVLHLQTDGLTFLGNQHRRFSRLDSLFEDSSGSLIHAEGSWESAESKNGNTVGVSFGPQNGPVTALQVEEAIRAAKQYDDLVLAGFSFDAEAFAVVQEQNHPKLRIHLAHIRPDLNEAMNGLLKNTVNSELFAVFGQPEIDVHESSDGWICTLKGVDIYNPLDNTVRSSGADKVAAWFLDGDFDGRCFCITQAFFPDQDAWEKIADALGSSADLEAFERLEGTTSLPFRKGKYCRIAVKVIDPRGNEVMAIKKLP